MNMTVGADESRDVTFSGPTAPDIQSALFAVAVRHQLSSIGVNLAAFSGFALLTWKEYPTVAGWLGAAISVTILRLIFHFRYLRPAIAGEHDRIPGLSGLRAAYRLGLIAAATVWVYPTLFDLSTMASENRSAYLIIVSALAGGAMGVLAPDVLIGRVYVSLLLLPACACLALLGTYDEKVLAGLGAIFSLVMFSGLKANHEALVKSLSFAFENSALLARSLSHAEETENLNASLEERVRELRLARDDARAADRAKSTFLATMSHEIRTPMNGVIAMADDLLGKIHDPELHEQVEIITRSGAHLLRIIDDILDLSKLDTAQICLEEAPFNIKAVVDSASEVFGVRARDQGLDIKINLSEPVPAMVVGDGARLRQILLNLVSNAVKFTPSGEINVGVACQDDEASPNLVFEFIVSDTGVGMTEEALSHVFREFWQADSSISRQYGGTGLGLAICSRLIKVMGGAIHVTSKLGVGTKVAFSVPFRRAAEEPGCQINCATNDVAHEASFAGRRILLVEDNATNRQIAKIILAKTGAKVDTANDGREAVEAASSTQYDLILMDVHMPVMNGIEAAKAIRASAEPLRSVPIVALSASALPEERALCLSAGMDDFMSKPYRGDMLRGVIAKAFRGPKTPPKKTAVKTEPEAADAPAFHADAYQILAKEFGQEDTRQLLAEFMADARERLETIEADIASRKFPAIKNQAHVLKSSAAMLGLARLAQISRELEAAAAKEDWSQVAHLSLAASKALHDAEHPIADVLEAA
jgi:signal transduction histidine kinase/DNA-binding response OmpR family regulator